MHLMHVTRRHLQRRIRSRLSMTINCHDLPAYRLKKSNRKYFIMRIQTNYGLLRPSGNLGMVNGVVVMRVRDGMYGKAVRGEKGAKG